MEKAKKSYEGLESYRVGYDEGYDNGYNDCKNMILAHIKNIESLLKNIESCIIKKEK